MAIFLTAQEGKKFILAEDFGELSRAAQSSQRKTQKMFWFKIDAKKV
jgi:hypothetical protein